MPAKLKQIIGFNNGKAFIFQGFMKILFPRVMTGAHTAVALFTN